LVQIAIYGKGGIGKSTVASNLSASLALHGKKVLQIGCDPKHDSTRTLTGGVGAHTLLDLMNQKKTDELEISEFMLNGFNGVKCIEAGGPEPGVGCAGRGVILAIETMRKSGVYEQGFEYIIYDVLGDIVCGGFAVPIREGYAEEIYLVVSGEFMSLYAANNICKAIKKYAFRSGTRLAGVIGNLRGLPGEENLISKFAEKINSSVVGIIPRDNLIGDAEAKGKTVVEAHPSSDVSKIFFQLAEKICHPQDKNIPNPLEDEELGQLYAFFNKNGTN